MSGIDLLVTMKSTAAQIDGHYKKAVSDNLQSIVLSCIAFISLEAV